MNRKRQKLFKYSVDLFIELLKQVTKRTVVNYKCNSVDVNAFDNFMDKLGNVGEDYIRKFEEYGFQSWFNDSCKEDNTYNIRYSWIFGKPAIKRWNALTGDVRTKIVRKSLKKRVRINTLNNDTKLPELLNCVRAVEEKFKAAYYNTNRGLLWCVANTTLYHHRSVYCATCNFKDNCKEILKTEYPKVYKIRGYGE